jgi:hypothetical protein
MSRHTLFTADRTALPKTHVSETTDQDGDTLRVKGGALIDGKLKSVTIIGTADSMVKNFCDGLA